MIPEERITSHLKSTLTQLRLDLDQAFADASGNIDEESSEKRVLGLTEYLLKIKEHELQEITTEHGRFTKTVLELAKACNLVLSDHPDVRYILKNFSRVLDATLIFWLQSGHEYDIYSVGIDEPEAADFFISLLPILSDEKTPMPYFQLGLDHYLVYTETDKKHSDKIKAVIFIREERSFLGYEQELAAILSELIFKIKVG